MNFIKYGDKRINLDLVSFVEPSIYKRMKEDGSTVDVYSVYISSGNSNTTIEFDTPERMGEFLSFFDEEYVKKSF